MDRHGHLDLLALGEPPQIGVYQPSVDGMYLAVLENDIVDPYSVNIEREYSVHASVSSQNCSQVFEFRGRRQTLCAAAVDDNRDPAGRSQPAVLILTASLPFFRSYSYFV